MSKNIVRSITTTTLKVMEMVESSEGFITKEMKVPTIIGSMKKEQIIKKLNKQFPDRTFKLINVETTTKTYSLPIELFIEHGTEVLDEKEED